MTFSSPLWLVDAFVAEGCLGNTAGVCLVKEYPAGSVMQHIAFELGWAETAFVCPEGPQGRFHIRWFSPKDEAPICGHATLASAHILWEQMHALEEEIVLTSRAGTLTVRTQTDDSGRWITMNFPAYPVSLCGFEEESSVRKALSNLSPIAIYRDALTFLVVCEKEEDVANYTPDLAAISSLPCRAVMITAASCQPGFDFVSRYFAPKVGIPEDPVCGSAHCRLTPFWAGRLGKPHLVARQLSARGGVLRLTYNAEHSCVTIAGHARTVFSGNILV